MSIVGVSLEDVARHVGWRSLDIADYYTQMGRVLNMSHTALALVDSTLAAVGFSLHHGSLLRSHDVRFSLRYSYS